MVQFSSKNFGLKIIMNHISEFCIKFKVRYYRVTGKSLEFPKLKILIVVISTGCLLCAILFLLSLNALLEGFLLWHTSAYLHIITMINMNCALWYINCRAIKDASNSLSRDFKEVNGIKDKIMWVFFHFIRFFDV